MEVGRKSRMQVFGGELSKILLTSSMEIFWKLVRR
jgi:hypothetical protein